jgi:DNA-binding CsgD family transcriptional regulator
VDRVAKGAGDAAPQVRPTVDGYLDLCAAEISRIEDRHDPEPWARAAAAWDKRKQPYPAAYSRLRQAEASFARKIKRSVATAALREAWATAQAMGARPFAAEISSVAARAKVSLTPDDAPPQAVVVAGPDDELGVLTDREREVLAAVAEGLTNREIGQRLFISERTVGVHVGHIFDKLQVRSRVQASRVYLRAA